AQRYARALYSIVKEKNAVAGALNEIREFNAALQKDKELKLFFEGPATKSSETEATLTALFAKKTFSEDVKGLLFLLAAKRRFELLNDIVQSFQTAVDESQGVARGHVHSATTLFPEERQSLEQTISKYTG